MRLEPKYRLVSWNKFSIGALFVCCHSGAALPTVVLRQACWRVVCFHKCHWDLAIAGPRLLMLRHSL
jgi:hypothetical protein